MTPIFINKRVRVYKDQVTHIKRVVPVSFSRINVKIGDEVSPEVELGEGQLDAGFVVVDLAKQLGEGARSAHVYLKRKIGQIIYEGELLAEREDILGLRKKMVLSPVDGIVDSYDEKNGHLKLKIVPKKTRLVSGVYGIVDAIDQKTGMILIRTKASIIKGIVGSGREREGLIKIIGSPEALVSSRQIKPDFKGEILVGGGLVFLDALKKALDTSVTGIICGGVNAFDFKTLAGKDWSFASKAGTDVGLTLLVTEGFGSAPIGADVYPLLVAHDHKFAILDGNGSQVVLPTQELGSMIDIRKSKISLPDSLKHNFEANEVELTLGLKVRVVSTTFLGTQGVVTAIDQAPTRLPSEVYTYMVTVVTNTGKIRIPYQNLEAF